MIEALRDSLPHMLHTRDGARVAMHCVWHGTAKVRPSLNYSHFNKCFCKRNSHSNVTRGLIGQSQTFGAVYPGTVYRAHCPGAIK